MQMPRGEIGYPRTKSSPVWLEPKYENKKGQGDASVLADLYNKEFELFPKSNGKS